ncbi:PREDICTED: uncharacterized protein LOC105360143 [Ceratosolen solmsi marchali]|uniref:Uncharacterized protein LOC105360143 n=1 Tax=Ceratosolen solmsi marchali TaxID=326594 RepID=A0AAJ6VL53_9HYME|nr:PREDICTED: uncharacterized protein LOC105360143 [Ceratosolen solmsi marchali]
MGFRVLCVSMKIFGIWPIPNSPRAHCIFYRFLWWFYLLNHLILILPTFHTFLNNNTGNVTLASITWLEMTGMMECMVILINFKIQEKRLKELLRVTKNQLNSTEASISLENANLYVIIVSTIAILYIIVMYMYGNRPDRSTILTTTRYPFSIESTALKVLIFCNQFIAMSHTAVVMVTDGIFVLFSYVCAVRLKLLEKKLKTAKINKELKQYICEHQNILFLIEETNVLVGIMIVKSIICFMSYSIGVGLQIIDPKVSNFEVMNNFLTIVLIYLRLFISAESAETMATVDT